MTESSKEINEKANKSKSLKTTLKKSIMLSNRDSLNNNSSAWSNESTVNQIKSLSNKLKKEKKE